jgi:formylglycine-generating enzyme required for sulfatase activity
MTVRLLLTLLCVLFAAPPAQATSAQAPDISPAGDLKKHVNSIGMEFVLIPAGSIERGMVVNELNEIMYKPKVMISKPFYLGTRQVTQEQWMAVMGSNPARFKGRSNPVETVSWDDAQEFIRLLNAKEKHNRYRLPTEAEWELAARGGTDSQFFFIKDPKAWEEVENALGDYAWLQKNSGRSTHPVGQKKPNQYGLYDIFGNVWEWMQDWYEELPADREFVDYHGPASGLGRVLRGGSWDYNTINSRWDIRIRVEQRYRGSYVGFRLALSVEEF